MGPFPRIGFVTLAVTRGAILGGQIVPVLKTDRGAGLLGKRKPAAGPVQSGPGFPVEPHEKSRVFNGGSLRVRRVGRPCSKALEKQSFRFGVARTWLLEKARARA